MTGATGGTYTLLIELGSPATVTFGAAGERALEAGYYAYVGSAFGPGGFARIERHRELAAGDRDARHWHIDYLLGHDTVTLLETVRTPGEDLECAVADRLRASVDPVAGLGASDCGCRSHLFYGPDRARLHDRIRAAHTDARLDREATG